MLGMLVAFAGMGWGRSLSPSLANPSGQEAETIGDAIAPPFWVDAEAGTVWKIFGLEIVGKVFSEQTNGQYSVIVTTTPSQGGPPRHRHQHEDELFYILQGTYEFRVGDKTIIANEGDWVHLPRNLPHRYRNIGSEAGKTLNIMTPGGFEQFFAEIDALPKDRPPDRQQVRDIGARYGLTFLPEETE